MSRPDFCLVSAVAACAVIWLSPAIAWACGAFALPVTVEYDPSQEADGALVHNAERMLYVDRGDGRWTVYQGRSIDADDEVDEIAWLLPVFGVPEVEVAPPLVFQRLQEATDPEFVLQEESTGDCPAEVRNFLRKDALDLGRSAAPATSHSVDHEAQAPAVRAVDTGSVGPYDHVTIETEKGIDDPGKKVVEWLEDHDYHVASVDVDLLREYLDDGLNLFAMRLRADAGADDVQPVALTLEMERALSPMRLARMGAAEETNILVWTAAEGRAVPYGWPRVELEEGLVDWSDGGANYMDVVAAAVDEAGGRGFATDYLMDTDATVDRMWSEEAQHRWPKIRSRTDFEGRETATLEAIGELFDHDDLLAQILRDELPTPGADELATQIDAGHFSAEYASDPFSRHPGADPEDFLGALRDGRFIAHCFESALESNGQAGGHFAATVVNPSRNDELFEDVDASLDDAFSRCVTRGIERHIEIIDYAPGLFPVEMELRFTNPYESRGENNGFPALMAMPDEALEAVDWNEVVARIDETIATPLKRAADRLAATDRLTRLSTVVAAGDLTDDVSFSQVPGHRDRPATRKATREIECGGVERREGREVYTVRDWSMELERGEPVTGRGESWPVAIGDRDAARLIVEYDRWGRVVDERGEAIDGEVEEIEVDEEARAAEEKEGKDDGIDDGHADDAGGIDETKDDPETDGDDAWWQWLLGALAAFSVVSMVLVARRRTGSGS